MAKIAPLDVTTEEARALLGPLRHDFSVAIHSAGNPFAVGAILRVCHNFLAREVFIIGNDPYYPKGSMGMEKFEQVSRVDEEELFVRAGGRPVWAFERDHATLSLDRVRAFPPGVIFAFGSERFGLPASFLARADAVVGIPVYGLNHSLPVTVAAGIAMHAWASVRYASGQLIGGAPRT